MISLDNLDSRQHLQLSRCQKDFIPAVGVISIAQLGWNV